MSMHRPCAGPRIRRARGGLLQTAGGPRPGGRPGIGPAGSTVKVMAATRLPGKVGIKNSGNTTSVRPSEPHRSQCAPLGCAELLPAAAPSTLLLVAAKLFKLQTPPSLPLCTSCASIDTGAHNADNSATKLRKAAKRDHHNSAWLDWVGL